MAPNLSDIQKMDLTKIPLAFAEGGILKKAATWNQKEILKAGIRITQEIIGDYSDIALHIPTSLRIETTVSALENLINKNIEDFKERQKNEKMRDLSEIYPKDAIIFQQGDVASKDCFFLTEGAVSVFRDDKLLVTIEETGAPIGEMSFLSGEPRTATLKAACDDTKLLRVGHSERKKLMKNNPTLVSTLLEVLVKRLSSTSEKLVGAQKEVEDAVQKAAEASSQLDIGADVDSLIKANEKCKTLATRLLDEYSVRKGNSECFSQILAALEKKHAESDGGLKADEVLAAMRGYMEYINSHEISTHASSKIDLDKMPESLLEFFG